MLEGLAMTILKTLVGFIFQQALEGSSVKVEGAPRWYGKHAWGSFCVSTYQYGGLEAVEEVKGKLKVKMSQELRGLIEKALYENFRDVQDPKELAFIRAVAEDEKLPLFVSSYMKIRNLEYDEDKRVAFARGCISKEDFVAYQEKRLREIRKALSIKRSEDAFRELEMVE